MVGIHGPGSRIGHITRNCTPTQDFFASFNQLTALCG